MTTVTTVVEPYRGRTAAMASRHGKDSVVAPPLREVLGLAVAVADVDTDALGTFTGEVERPGPPAEVVVAKARLGMAALGLPLGLASEASFGPHPAAPVLAVGDELLAFVDDELGLVVVEREPAAPTNHAHLDVAPDQLGDDLLARFLTRSGFPEHRLVVVAADPPGGRGVWVAAKGIGDRATLATAVTDAASVSADGRARLLTDMRAHANPTRQQVLADLAARLARRLATPCPACGGPGFGQVGVERGLPCRGCGTPTAAVVARVLGCPGCGHRGVRPLPEAAAGADPAVCPVCNP